MSDIPECAFGGCYRPADFLVTWRGDLGTQAPVCDQCYRWMSTGRFVWVQPVTGKPLKPEDARELCEASR